MQNNQEKTRNSVFIKTLRRGVLCSLIPLLFMSTCIFVLDLQRSLEQLGSVTVNMLAQSDQMVHYMMEDVMRSISTLAKDPSVVDFSMRPYLRDTERNSNLCTLLSTLSDSYSYVEESILYSPYESLQISSSGLIAYGLQEELSDNFQQAKDTCTACMQISSVEGGMQKMFLTIGIPAYSNDPQAIAVLQIDPGAFFTLSMGGDLKDNIKRNLYISDRDGNLLFSDQELEFSQKITLPHSDLSTGSHLTLAGSALLRYSVFTNPQLGWRYTYVTGALSGNNSWLPLVIPLLISVLASCVIGLLLAYQSTKVLYSPLEQLISALPEPEAETSQDEYQRLAGYYDQLLNQRDEVYEQVEAIRPLLLKKFLVSLADSTQISRDEVLYQVRILEVPFQATLFNAFFLQIDNYYALPYSEQEKQELKAQMQAQISACASSIAYCAATELNDETLLIICNLHSEEPPEIGKQSFRALAEEIREELEGLWPITVTLGIGQICRCVEDLPLSCQRAKAALAYKLYRGQGSIIDFEEVQVEPHQIYYDFETVHQVVNRVRTGDGRGAVHLLQEIFRTFSSQQQVPPKQVRAVLQYLTSGIGEIIQSVQLPLEPPAELESELSKKATLPDMEVWLTELCMRTAEAMRRTSSDRVRQNAERIKAYIDNNLTQDISLSSISEYVNYSPTYVSRVFRQHYGASYIDYLNSSRVKLSQELLSARGDLSVKEIGFQVGFNNLQSFFRIFKKYTGMTPLQYRERQDR